MSDIVEVRLRRVKDYVSALREKLKIRLVILFGSFARGDWTESSDIDLLVVADDLGDDVGENYVALKSYGIEPIGYRTKSFLREILRPNLLIHDALRYGRVLYLSDQEFMDEVRKMVEEAEKKFDLRWNGETWRWNPRKLNTR